MTYGISSTRSRDIVELGTNRNKLQESIDDTHANPLAYASVKIFLVEFVVEVEFA